MDDLRGRGAKIIIGDFYEEVARKVKYLTNSLFFTGHCFYVHRLCAKPTDLKWLRNKVLFGSFPDGIKMVGLTQMSLLWKSQKWTAGRPEKDKGQTSCFFTPFTIFLNFRIQEEDQIWFDDDVFVGELPDCNTSEMIEALDGK